MEAVTPQPVLLRQLVRDGVNGSDVGQRAMERGIEHGNRGDVRQQADRRRLGFTGIVSVALALDGRGDMVGEPEIELIGIPELNADKQSMHEIAYDAAIETFESLPKPRRRDPQAVEEAVKRAVRAAIAGHWQKKPICLVQVLIV